MNNNQTIRLQFILVIFMLLTHGILQCVDAQAFHLEGNTKGHSGEKLFIYYTNYEQKDVSDSTIIKDDRYSFTGTVDGACLVYIGIKIKKNQWDPQENYGFFLEPGNITITQMGPHIKNSLTKGSKTDLLYQDLNVKEQGLDAAARFDLVKAFIHKYPQSAITAYLLRVNVGEIQPDSLLAYYNKLGAVMQASHNGRKVAKLITQLQKGLPGHRAQDFKSMGINGLEVHLSNYRGKYVLLDFWASWCVPCRAGNPHLKKLYQKYHEKGLEIIGVSDDDGAPDKWKAAVAKDGIGIWPNVLRSHNPHLAFGTEDPKDISTNYGIHLLPTKILIDTTGKIIGRFTGTEEAPLLDEALRKVFASS